MGADFDAGDSRKRVPAWGLSAGLHLLLILVLGWWMDRQPGAPIADEPTREVGIALVRRDQPEKKYLTESNQQDANSDATDTSMPQAIRDALPQASQLETSLPGFLPEDSEMGAIGAELGQELQGADDFLDGIAKGPKRGGDIGQTTTSVFGVQGTGTKFVYVFDRSGSMVAFGGKPLAAAKSQLLASLDSLGPNQQFQIIFYNERPRAFTPRGGRPRLLYATDENKRKASEFVAGIPGGGSTRHLPALKLAVDFGPDVVFFLTDAAEPIISDEDLRVIDRWNRNAASIHAIEFGTVASPAADNFLKKLARFNGGNYVYKNVTSFQQ